MDAGHQLLNINYEVLILDDLDFDTKVKLIENKTTHPSYSIFYIFNLSPNLYLHLNL